MRQLMNRKTWDYKLEKAVREDFKVFEGGFQNGFVAEAFIEKRLGKPICKYTGTPDKGWDFLLANGEKVDVKNTSIYNNEWKIDCGEDGSLPADVYLFTKMDLGNCDFYEVGYLESRDIQLLCKHCSVKEVPFYYRQGKPCYIVKESDIVNILN